MISEALGTRVRSMTLGIGEALARAGLTPNMVTTIGVLLGVVVVADGVRLARVEEPVLAEGVSGVVDVVEVGEHAAAPARSRAAAVMARGCMVASLVYLLGRHEPGCHLARFWVLASQR